MYKGVTHKIHIAVNGEVIRTLRVTDKAVKNKMAATNHSFPTSLALMIRPQFRQGVGKDTEHPAAYDKVYRARMLRECVEVGHSVSECGTVSYSLLTGHSETDSERYKGKQ